jgi:hypothetical protein
MRSPTLQCPAVLQKLCKFFVLNDWHVCTCMAVTRVWLLCICSSLFEPCICLCENLSLCVYMRAYARCVGSVVFALPFSNVVCYYALRCWGITTVQQHNTDTCIIASMVKVSSAPANRSETLFLDRGIKIK